MLIAFSTKGHRMTARKDGHVPGNVPGKLEAAGGRAQGDNCQVKLGGREVRFLSPPRKLSEERRVKNLDTLHKKRKETIMKQNRRNHLSLATAIHRNHRSSRRSCGQQPRLDGTPYALCRNLLDFLEGKRYSSEFEAETYGVQSVLLRDSEGRLFPKVDRGSLSRSRNVGNECTRGMDSRASHRRICDKEGHRVNVQALLAAPLDRVHFLS